MTVNQLETNARFVGFLLVRSADARTDKKGGSYLDLTLADKTGDINCKYWDWNQLMDVPKQGSVIKVQGLVQEYNSRKQLRIERMRAALPQDEVDMAQLVACAPEKPEVMRKDIEDTIDTFQSEGLKKIVREMLRLTGDKLEWFPAAQRLHHAERSGLLHHTTSMLNLARHVVALAQDPAMTASTQWLERTLDDSANRRISIPEAFLAADAILSLAMNVLRGCRVYPEMMARHLADELPFLATENILMRAVSLGGDRQELHEAIREYSVATARRMKETGFGNDLAERLLADPRFHLDEAALAELMDVRRFVGMAPQQAERYVRGRVLPLLDANRGRAAAGREISC